MSNEPIDAVITWVNGKDPKHKEKVKTVLKALDVKTEAADSTRFCEVGEFEYCLASLIKNAPWLRKIFIVTDNQEPPFWNKVQKSKHAHKIILINHSVIFKGYEEALPTFNCRSIFALLWKIPELSEKYIYLDDDFLLLRPVSPNHFFHNDKLVLRGTWELQQSKRIWDPLHKPLFRSKLVIPRAGNRRGQAYAAAKAGYSKYYFRAPHNPHPQFKSIQLEYYSKREEELKKQVSYKFRSEEQYVPTALTTHLALKKERAIVAEKNSGIRLKLNKLTTIQLLWKIWWVKKNSNVIFGCLQSLDLASPKLQKRVFKWLKYQIGTLDQVLSK